MSQVGCFSAVKASLKTCLAPDIVVDSTQSQDDRLRMKAMLFASSTSIDMSSSESTLEAAPKRDMRNVPYIMRERDLLQYVSRDGLASSLATSGRSTDVSLLRSVDALSVQPHESRDLLYEGMDQNHVGTSFTLMLRSDYRRILSDIYLPSQ